MNDYYHLKKRIPQINCQNTKTHAKQLQYTQTIEVTQPRHGTHSSKFMNEEETRSNNASVLKKTLFVFVRDQAVSKSAFIVEGKTGSYSVVCFWGVLGYCIVFW